LNDNEAKELFKFVIDTHKALSQILRFSTVPTIHKQNVAEHSYFVALIAWLICVRMETKGIEINTEKVLKLSLIHDLPESVSGDMPRSVKKGEIRKIITELEDSVFQMMIGDLPEDMYDELSATYRRWELGDSLEEKVMRFSDILESAIYCLCEKELGNSNMDRIISNMIIWIDGFEDELMKSLGNEYKRKVVCEE